MYRVSTKSSFFPFVFFLLSLSRLSRLVSLVSSLSSLSLDSLTSGAFNCFIVFTFSLSSRSFVPKIRHSEVVLTLSSRVCVGGSRTRTRGVRERALPRSNFITHRGRDYSQKREIFR